MAKYAEATTVSIDKSMGEIRSTLTRFGATGFLFAEGSNFVTVMFEMQRRQVHFTIKLPSLSEFERTPERRMRRSAAAQLKEHDQALRQRYRALLLVIKAKLEAIESGIENFDEAFLAHFILPDGQSMATWMAPQMDALYERGEMPKRLALPAVIELPDTHE